MPKRKDQVSEQTVITKIVKEKKAVKKPFILFLAGPLVGKLYQLTEGSTVVGRAPDANIVVDDIRVSRHHVKLAVKGEGVEIEDLGSTNGTFVNGRKIIKRQALADGDKIQISSSTLFKFALQDKAENIFHKELYKMAIIDPVTNIYNKRFFLERLKEEFGHTKRTGYGLSLLMIDIDHFKKINDTYGHLAGDMVLQQLASTLKSVVRGEDILARYGGEEFVVILRETKRPGAINLAERMRGEVEGAQFTFEEDRLSITISIGVASMEGDYATPDELIKAADDKLYQSKEGGRNRVTA